MGYGRGGICPAAEAWRPDWGASLPRNSGKRMLPADNAFARRAIDMEMSVTPALNRDSDDKPPKGAVDRRAGYGPNSSDLDIWLQKAEAMGELKRITAEVDPDLEMATIAYLV